MVMVPSAHKTEQATREWKLRLRKCLRAYVDEVCIPVRPQPMVSASSTYQWLRRVRSAGERCGYRIPCKIRDEGAFILSYVLNLLSWITSACVHLLPALLDAFISTTANLHDPQLKTVAWNVSKAPHNTYRQQQQQLHIKQRARSRFSAASEAY